MENICRKLINYIIVCYNNFTVYHMPLLCSALACIVFLLMCCLYPGRCEQSVTNEYLALLMRPLGSGGVIKLCTVWPGNNKNVFLIVKRRLNQSLVEMNLIYNNVYVHTSTSDKASCYISWITFPNWYRRMTWFMHIIQITITTRIFNIHRVMNISSISPIVDKHDGMGPFSWTPSVYFWYLWKVGTI